MDTIAGMRVIGGILLGAAIGALWTSFGLVEITSSGVSVGGGGNEWTPFVTGGATLFGAGVGATAFFRRHLFAALFLGLGMVVAIALRDHYQLQPPSVFFNLFGIPALAAAAGVWLDDRRNKRPTSTASNIGIAVSAIVIACVAVIAISHIGRDTSVCRSRGAFTVCNQFESQKVLKPRGT